MVRQASLTGVSEIFHAVVLIYMNNSGLRHITP